MNLLEVKGLYHNYGDKEVLCGLDFHIEEHSIVGLIGKNGAGKSTAMKAILGLIRPKQGDVFVCGEKVQFNGNRTNPFIGYLPDVPQFYSFFNAREYLNFCGQIAGMDSADLKIRIDELLELAGLKEEKHRIRGYSRGMKQRLGIAQALLHRPKLLLCDEPTSALDPIGRKEILDLLYQAKEYTTILFSSHILSDVERICSQVIFLSDGVAKINGSVNDLKQLKGTDTWIIEAENENDLHRLQKIYPAAKIKDQCVIEISDHGCESISLMKCLAEENISIRKVERKESTLESLFLEVTGK